MNWIDYLNELNGFDFYCKRTNKQVFKWQLYWSNLSPSKVFDNYNKVLRDNKPIN